MATDPRPTLGRSDPDRSDPARPGADGDIRPIVARASGGPSTLMIALGMGAAGLALFLLLDTRRQSIEAPAVRASAAERAGPPAPPPLQLPAAPPPPAPVEAPPTVPFVLPQPPAPPAAPQIVYVPQPQAPMPAPAPVETARAARDGATLVIDTTAADGAAASEPAPADGVRGTTSVATNPAFAATSAAPGARARATMLAGRATSVMQGTLIPAVLESGLDTTRPGLARALVSQDVRGFDGSRVLIPRGSRLTGEYRSDAAPGQNRALIVWTRLVRPDGAVIAIASSASDTQGRGGVKAKVDSHFLARFGSAILQSVLAVGVNLASRSSNNDTVVLGLPGASIGGFGAGGFGQGTQVTPTLKVKPGASIGVFVARDLDFSAVEGRR